MTKNPEKRILVIGDVMLDIYHFGEIKRISPEAPVPVFSETKDIRYVPGGAANVAVNLAAIGTTTDLLGVIGEDEDGQKLAELMRERHIGIEQLRCVKNRGTTRKLRYIAQDHQQILRVDKENTEPIAEDFSKEVLERLSSEIGKYSLILLSDYLKGFLTESFTQALIQLANQHKIPIFVDVKDQNVVKYRNATLLKPNRKELSELSGMEVRSKEDAIAAAQALCEITDCVYVLATLGAEGMVLVNREGLIREIQSAAREVYDVTGAGDTSIAYLSSEYVGGRSFEEAMEIANYAAGLQVAKVGTSIVYPTEVKAAMEKNTAAFFENKFLKHYLTSDIDIFMQYHNEKKKIVFTNGCFDILHPGHITYLNQAKALGDILVVGLNSDASVRRLKGEERPINSLEDRAVMLASLAAVDFVIPFEEDTPLKLIQKVQPDVLVKGGDYTIDRIVGAKEVISRGGEVKTLPFVDGQSTTGIIEKLRKG